MFCGKKIILSVFGESHGAAIGCVIEGFPAGESLDEAELAAFMKRRAPGGSLATPRKESDQICFLSGIHEGFTGGSPIAAVIKNADAHSKDYDNLRFLPRPSHADYTASIRYGKHMDMRGGGHFSGRITAPVCVAGGLALQVLRRRGVEISAKIASVGGVISDDEAVLRAEIARAAADGDSVGGVISCAITGLAAGLGGLQWDGAESRLAAALFAIPAVKAVEFGAGFAGCTMIGSTYNDSFRAENGAVITESNNHGGILGGITSGMPVTFNVGVKPTPSIAKQQRTVDLSDDIPKNAELVIRGRHDPCVALRAAPVVEAVAAIVALDLILE